MSDVRKNQWRTEHRGAAVCLRTEEAERGKNTLLLEEA